jgi:hypothetical protein
MAFDAMSRCAIRFSRRCDEALHPGGASRSRPLSTLVVVGEYNFAGQYQQSPAAPGRWGLVRAKSFRYYIEKGLVGGLRSRDL